MDLADEAMEIEEQAREHALSIRHLFVGESAQECVECADPINEQRRKSLPGVQLCVSCAQENETRGSRK